MSGMNPSTSQKEKYIHNVGNINSVNNLNNNFQQPYQQTYQQPYQQQSNEYFRYPQYQNQGYHSRSNKENYNNSDNEDETDENYTSSTTTAAPCSLNCRDISFHIVDCPVCSVLYYNDKTMYIIIIIVLFCVILILLQKLLNSGKF